MITKTTWRSNVRRRAQKALAPAPDRGDTGATIDDLEVKVNADGTIKAPLHNIGGAVTVDSVTATDLEHQFVEALNAVKAAEADLRSIEARVKDALGTNDMLVEENTGRVLFTWKASVKRILDQARLRDEAPELAAQFERPSASRTFRQHLLTRKNQYTSTTHTHVSA